MTKKCFKCSTSKPLGKFYTHSGMADGRLGKCKECSKKDVRENYKNNIKHYNDSDRKRYRNNPERMFKLKYSGMRRRINGLNKHSNLIGKELISKKEFLVWCNNNLEKFNQLRKNWARSGYKRKLAPSIDRIDNSVGYIVGNMAWITQSENSKKQ